MNKLAIIFTTAHADTLGNANRLKIVEYLSNSFDATIITNQKNFLETKFSKCKIIEYERYENKYLPIISGIVEWKKTAAIINRLDCYIVFMIVDTSPVTLWLKPSVFQYVHQYGDRSDKKSSILRKIFRNIIGRIRDCYYIKGLQKSKKVFVISKPIIDILNKKGVKNLVQISHAIDIGQFKNPKITEFHQPLKLLKEKSFFVVTYTGWVTENRGFRLMLETIKQAATKDNKIVLVFAGADAAFSRRISDFARRFKLENNILNFGVIDVSLIPGVLYYSDVCLSFLDDFPAYHISPPQKVVEYFAAGKPVICNKIEPHEWLVTHRENGFIVDYNADQVSDAILELKKDQELLNTMSANAAKEACRYDINEVYGRMVRIMNDSIVAHKK